MSQREFLTFREEPPARKVLFAALIVFLCLVNFLVSFLMEVTRQYGSSGLLVFGSAGGILSQVALLGFLLIYLPFGLIARFVAVGFLGMLFWLSLLAGAYLFAFPGLYVLEDLAKMLPLFVLAVATPFATAKHFLGWEVQFDELTDQKNSQLGTVNLLSATGLVAASMAILSSGKQELILPGLIATAICLAVSLAFLLPLTRVVLGFNRPFFMIVSISVVTLFLVLLLIWLIEQYAGPLNGWVRLGISFAIASFPFWFGIELLLFRRFSGRLIIERRRAKAD